MADQSTRIRAIHFALNVPRIASAGRLIEVTLAFEGLLFDWSKAPESASVALQEQVLHGAFVLLIRNEPDEFDDAALARFLGDARELMAAFVAPAASQPLAGGV